VLFQSWKCHPESNSAVDYVEWLGMEASARMHHHSKLFLSAEALHGLLISSLVRPNAAPRTFHISQQSQVFDLVFDEQDHVVFFTDEGVIHDKFITAEYTFTSVEKLHDFEGDLRRKKHVSSFDMQVIWSNKHSEKNAMGTFSGMATLEKLNIWKDQRYPYRHSISFLASKSSGEHEEFKVQNFKTPIKRKNETVWLEKHGDRERRGSGVSTTSGNQRSSLLRRFTRRPSSSEGKQPLVYYLEC
jgi:hypothetical protein